MGEKPGRIINGLRPEAETKSHSIPAHNKHTNGYLEPRAGRASAASRDSQCGAVGGVGLARFDLRQVARMPAESTIRDTQGATIGSLHGDGRMIVPLDEVSDHFKNALVAREDSRFYTHGGFDAWALFRAGIRNTRDGGETEADAVAS